MSLLRFAAAIALFAAAFAACPSLAKEADAAAKIAAPPLWRISDGKSTVYLFGEIGLAPEKADAGARWRTLAVVKAIDESETVWLEAPVREPEAQAAANRIFSEEGMLPKGERLSSNMPPETAIALSGVAAKAGLAAGALEPLKPWAAFVVLSSRVNAEREGGETIEEAILKEARGRGRNLRYFDTVENSLRILTDMPHETQTQMLAQLVADFDRQRSGAEAGFEAWRTGDLAALDAYLIARMRADAPEAYELLVVRRIKSLTNGVGAALKDGRTAFISLSASYLVGPDALPVRLQEMGLSVERLGE